MNGKYRKPLPEPDQVTLPFWEAAKRHEFRLQYCENCQRFVHPPKPVCSNCSRGERLDWRGVSGRGRVHTFGIVHHQGIQGFEDDVPYAAGLIELDEQSGLLFLSNIVNCDPDSVAVDMPVRAIFVDATDEIALIKFVPESSSPS